MDWIAQALAVVCDAIAADMLEPLAIFHALGLKPPQWYAASLWSLAAPFVAISLRLQERRKGRRE